MTDQDQFAVPSADGAREETPVADADAAASAVGGAGAHETSTQVEAGLVRSVRYGRIIVGAAVVGGVIAAIAALFFPVAPDATYDLGQAVGLSLVVGAVIGLALGALLSLLLGLTVRRRRGAAIVVLTDVR